MNEFYRGSFPRMYIYTCIWNRLVKVEPKLLFKFGFNSNKLLQTNSNCLTFCVFNTKYLYNLSLQIQCLSYGLCSILYIENTKKELSTKVVYSNNQTGKTY